MPYQWRTIKTTINADIVGNDLVFTITDNESGHEHFARSDVSSFYDFFVRGVAELADINCDEVGDPGLARRISHASLYNIVNHVVVKYNESLPENF